MYICISYRITCYRKCINIALSLFGSDVIDKLVFFYHVGIYNLLRCYTVHVFITDLSPVLRISGAANNSNVSLAAGEVVLQCIANGNPQPVYQWLDLDSMETINGQTFIISTAREYSLQCTASNDVTFANGNVVPRSVSATFYINGTFSPAVFCSHLQQSSPTIYQHSYSTRTRYIVDVLPSWF